MFEVLNMSGFYPVIEKSIDNDECIVHEIVDSILFDKEEIPIIEHFQLSICLQDEPFYKKRGKLLLNETGDLEGVSLYLSVDCFTSEEIQKMNVAEDKIEYKGDIFYRVLLKDYATFHPLLTQGVDFSMKNQFIKEILRLYAISALTFISWKDRSVLLYNSQSNALKKVGNRGLQYP